MTSKVLTNAVIHNGRQNIKQSLKVTLIILALHLLGAPLLIINTAYNFINGINTSPDGFMTLIAGASTFIAGCAGILIALMNFRYLYNKSQVDMCLAQPMSRRQRFISDYLSGLISYVGPFIAVQAVSAIMLLIAHLAMDGREFDFGTYSNGMKRTEICTAFGDAAPYYGKIVFAGILTMIMLYTLTVLVSACCGALFETVAYTIFANAAIPLTILLTMYGFFNDLNGVSFEYIFVPLTLWTSPAGGIAAIFFDAAYCESNSFGYYRGMPLWQWSIGFVIVVALMVFGAYLLYMKRKAEQVSKPFVFKGLYYITVTFIVFCVTALFAAEGGKIAPLLITTFVIYMLLDIISRRGFRRIWTGLVRYAVTMACLLGFAALVDVTDCFGIETKVPSASSVSKIHISYNGAFNDYNTISDSFRYYTGKENEKLNLCAYEITSPENIEAVISAHRSLVTKNPNSDGITDMRNRISICYFLKNGTRMVRNYSYMNDGALNALLPVETSQEYTGQRIAYIRDMCDKSYDFQLKTKLNGDDKGPRIQISPVRRYEYPDRFNASEKYPDREFFDLLGAALENDLRNLPADKYFRPSSPTAYRLSFNSEIRSEIKTLNILVTKDMKETFALLYSCGFISNVTDEDILSHLYKLGPCAIKIYSSKDFQSMTGTNDVSTETLIRNENKSFGRYITDYSDDLLQIMKVMHAAYITDEPCYTIRIDGKLYVIPMEYSRTAEKLYDEAHIWRGDDDENYFFNKESARYDLSYYDKNYDYYYDDYYGAYYSY